MKKAKTTAMCADGAHSLCAYGENAYDLWCGCPCHAQARRELAGLVSAPTTDAYSEQTRLRTKREEHEDAYRQVREFARLRNLDHIMELIWRSEDDEGVARRLIEQHARSFKDVYGR